MTRKQEIVRIYDKQRERFHPYKLNLRIMSLIVQLIQAATDALLL